MTKPVHMMIRVLDADRSLDFYQRAFDLHVAGRFTFDDFELIYFSDKDGGFEIELTVNRGRTQAYNLGDGYGHVAFVVDDLNSEHARFEREGLRPGPIREMQWNGKPFGKLFFVQDPDGYKIEVLQKFGRFQ
jgi:lactoylglutathione lyase